MSHTTSITERVHSVTALDGAVRSTVPPFPRTAKVELTSRCDFHCYFCASQKRDRARTDMSQALFRRTALRLRRLGVDQLGLFFIGEAFLCAWLPDAIRYAKEVCSYPHVFLTTNGLAATPDRVRQCMLAGLDSLKFAVNCASPAQFQTVTGRSAERYSQVCSNLAHARRVRDEVQASTGHRCALYASSLEYDAEQRGRMAAGLAEIAALVDEHYWLPLYGHHGLPGKTSSARVPGKALPCSALFTEFHVTVDGQLCACCLDASPRFHMADLDSDTLTHAWATPAFQALRAAHLAGDVTGTVCEKCIAYNDTAVHLSSMSE